MPKSVRIDMEPNIIVEGSSAKIDAAGKKQQQQQQQLETILEDEKKSLEILDIDIIAAGKNDGGEEERKLLLTKTFSNPISEGGKSESEEIVEYEHAFLICCWQRPIMKSASTVCYLSALSFIANFLSLIFAGSQTSLHLAIEIIVLIIELFCLLLLFYALSHDAARCMKPYLLFGLLWNIFLSLLWLFCLAELIKGSYFPFRVSTTLSQAFLPSNSYYNRYQQRSQKDSLLTTLSVFIGLGGTILINFWFLHIIVLAYFYLQKKKQLQRQGYQNGFPWSPTATISSNNSPVSKQLPNGHTVFL